MFNLEPLRMKKLLVISLTLSAFFLISLQIDYQRVRTSGCAFCQQNILDAQVFFRGEKVLGLITHKPAVPGHVLIVLERHVERFEDLTAEEIAAIQGAIQKIDVAARNLFGHKDYLLLQKNGREAGQSVPHVHFHYLPAAKGLTIGFFVAPWLKPLAPDEMELLRSRLEAKIGQNIPRVIQKFDEEFY